MTYETPELVKAKKILKKLDISNISKVGKEVPTENLAGLFASAEGDIELIYGRIGNGKTTEAVRRILDDLYNGRVVYSNILLDLEKIEFDDRQRFDIAFWNFILFRKRFYTFDIKNYHYFNPDDFEDTEALAEFLLTITDAIIYYDEGHWVLDSYEKGTLSKIKRKLVLETRHHNRKIVFITQRPTAIAVAARGNVNVFYKCKRFMTFPFLIFKVIEYQDMKNETVDEENHVKIRWYFRNKKVFKVFNSYYLNDGVVRSQETYFKAYDLTFLQRAILLFSFIYPFSKLKRENEEINEGG